MNQALYRLQDVGEDNNERLTDHVSYNQRQSAATERREAGH